MSAATVVHVFQDLFQVLSIFNRSLTPTLRSKFGERVFSHAGPAAWNRLQKLLRQAQTQLKNVSRNFYK